MTAHKFPLPGILAEIEEVAGREVAVTIATTYGGQRKKFPAPMSDGAGWTLNPKNWLVKALGRKVALTIVREFFPAGGDADIPSGVQVLNRQYVYENAHQLSTAEMAIVLKISERAVRRIKAALRLDGFLEGDASNPQKGSRNA